MANKRKNSEKLAARMGALYSRRDVAEYLGVGVSTLKAWERENPDLKPDYRLSQRSVRYSEKTVNKILSHAKRRAELEPVVA